MDDSENPYRSPRATAAAAPRHRLWLSSLLASSPAAFLAIALLFCAAERRHFRTSQNDPALLLAALPQLLCVALVAGLVCSVSRHPRPLRALLAGLVTGPMLAFLAYRLYPLLKQWA